MTPMIDFTVALLEAVGQWLASEPIIYLFGLVLFCFLCKAIKTLM